MGWSTYYKFMFLPCFKPWEFIRKALLSITSYVSAYLVYLNLFERLFFTKEEISFEYLNASLK